MNKPRGPLTLLATSRQARWWTVGLGAVVFLVGGCVYFDWMMTQAFHDMLVGENGPVPLRADWPDPLKELLDDPDGLEVDESTIQVHCLWNGWGGQTFVWRMDAAPGLFAHIRKRWELTEVNDPTLYILEGHRGSNFDVPTPAWWSPRDDGYTSFYVSPQVLGKGSHFLNVALDEKRNTIWVHYSEFF